MSGFLSKRTEINKKRILEGTVNVFRKKGAKFTMNDISDELHMSKKTIYTIFRDKESLLFTMVEYFFDTVKDDEEKIWADDTLSIDDKLIKILAVMPESSKNLDFTSLYQIRDKYPRVNKRIAERIESDWGRTIELIEKGKAEGKFRNINTTIFQTVFEASIERFLVGDDLIKNKIKYIDALNELSTMLVKGIRE